MLEEAVALCWRVSLPLEQALNMRWLCVRGVSLPLEQASILHWRRRVYFGAGIDFTLEDYLWSSHRFYVGGFVLEACLYLLSRH